MFDPLTNYLVKSASTEDDSELVEELMELPIEDLRKLASIPGGAPNPSNAYLDSLQDNRLWDKVASDMTEAAKAIAKGGARGSAGGFVGDIATRVGQHNGIDPLSAKGYALSVGGAGVGSGLAGGITGAMDGGGVGALRGALGSGGGAMLGTGLGNALGGYAGAPVGYLIGGLTGDNKGPNGWSSTGADRGRVVVKEMGRHMLGRMGGATGANVGYALTKKKEEKPEEGKLASASLKAADNVGRLMAKQAYQGYNQYTGKTDEYADATAHSQALVDGAYARHVGAHGPEDTAARAPLLALYENGVAPAFVQHQHGALKKQLGTVNSRAVKGGWIGAGGGGLLGAGLGALAMPNDRAVGALTGGATGATLGAGLGVIGSTFGSAEAGRKAYEDHMQNLPEHLRPYVDHTGMLNMDAPLPTGWAGSVSPHLLGKTAARMAKVAVSGKTSGWGDNVGDFAKKHISPEKVQGAFKGGIQGAMKGSAQGAATGAALGAVPGVVVGPLGIGVGAGAGAAAGATSGAVTGGLSGAVKGWKAS